MTTLKFAFQSETGRRVVEVFDNSGLYVATILPDNKSNGIEVRSFRINAVRKADDKRSVIVSFGTPQPWTTEQ
jgi:hypothetical protein